jgi:uncharacterized protein DUF222/HNH endonuclease
MAAIRWSVPHPSTNDRSIEDLSAAIVKLDRSMRAESYQLLVLIRELDDRFGWAKWSFASCAEWLAWTCGISLSAAREKVRTAHALRLLPAISEAFAEGRLSYSKVRALTRVAEEHDEDLLLAYALDASQTQVEQRCAQIRNVAPESTAAARLAWERRSLSISRNVARNTVLISVEVPAEDGELVALALDRAVAAGEVARGVEFGADGEKASASWCAQQADAMMAIMRAYLGGGDGATDSAGVPAASTADHCQVVVHVDAAALQGGAGHADLPLETIKRLTCDCSLVAVVEDERGNPLDVGRKQRTVSTALRRALWARDRSCKFPGCHRKRYVEAHHIKHWANHGATNLDNLTLLCWLHHRLLHEGGFRMRRDPDGGALHFTRPDGREIPRGGYRVEDMVDEPAVPPAAEENPSMEEFVNDAAPSMEGFPIPERLAHPSMEVREPRAAYRIACRSPTLKDKRRSAVDCGGSQTRAT